MVELHLTNGTTCAAAEVCPQVVTADVLMDGLLELCPQAVTANGQRTIPLAPPTAAELGVAKGMLLSNFSRADGRMIHCEFTAADLCELTTQVPACEASATDRRVGPHASMMAKGGTPRTRTDTTLELLGKPLEEEEQTHYLLLHPQQWKQNPRPMTMKTVVIKRRIPQLLMVVQGLWHESNEIRMAERGLWNEP